MVRDAMKEKFRQNPNLKQILLDTGARNILECTSSRKWGAGISIESKLFGTGKHPGRNFTGNYLQELRVEFRDEEMAMQIHSMVNTESEVTPPPPQPDRPAAPTVKVYTPPTARIPNSSGPERDTLDVQSQNIVTPNQE